jgi:RraA family protein
MVTKPQSAYLHPGPGFRIRSDFPRLPVELVKEFEKFEIPDISDQLNRFSSLDPGITCFTHGHHRLCGTVCTVRVFPGDNLMVHKSLDLARPGEVVVIAAGGALTNAVLGDLICSKAKHRGIAGFVVDGLIRDLPGILNLDFPVFARGVTPIGPLQRGPGEINFPIACGGVVINPGDILMADGTGIVVIPQDIAPELLIRLRRDQEKNVEYIASVQSGDFSNQWVDRILLDLNCPTVAEDDDAERLVSGDEKLVAHSGEESAVEVPTTYAPAVTPGRQ